ncbi:hypothetical protein [Paraflavitalea sp. CAU 1676]|uniref:hypothetical protein n=1 Tax=Paraflavitalea sp. CAU 1676 TaxID=3032598 RepID=UPI0023D9DECE|nr:hypothetical protein [Paraflavitalea sp. CAU 1676]MDF2189835.1 hypothetical protein [Paraflavitalea sp. CAU 1676]
MKFKLHQLEFELEGDQKVVIEQFDNFKSFIANDLLPKISVPPLSPVNVTPEIGAKQLTENAGIATAEINDFPALKEVVLRDLPNSETDWILIYACYKTSFGKESFSEQDIKDQYEKTGRSNKSRLANLSNNIKSLLNKKFIKVHNDTQYLIKSDGLDYAYKILEGKSTTKSSTKKSKKDSKEETESKMQSARRDNRSIVKVNKFSLDKQLNLRPDHVESLKEFAAKYHMDSSAKQIVVIVYYLKEILKLPRANANHIYTALDELDIRIPKSLNQIIVNTKAREGWLDYKVTDDINLSMQGRNAIKFDLQRKSK